ncbi:MAG: nucleotidyl transferase AbiEii/AbiGii toxin family protein [Candidatus Woesebacteria bacterium]|nr:nucleotidyl transferase AbiEii/AbiGii toxin family protein [Candidatus Woesebacteria bacterium]
MLKAIYSDTTVSPYLGFKGGTATLLFYDLDRFSVDLDFDLLDITKEEFVFDKVSKIVSKFGELKEATIKRFNIFYLVSYENGERNIKVEINRRIFDSRYEIKTYLGVSMQVMVKEDMFAHKLMAMYERMEKTSRDIYDVNFFLKKRFSINQEIIVARSKMSFDKFIEKCIKKLKKYNSKNILNGLGELITPFQKDEVKAKLVEETIQLLELR